MFFYNKSCTSCIFFLIKDNSIGTKIMFNCINPPFTQSELYPYFSARPGVHLEDDAQKFTWMRAVSSSMTS